MGCNGSSFPPNAKLMLGEDFKPSIILLPHKRHWFHYSCQSNQFWLSQEALKETHHLSVKFQSAFAQWPEGEQWQRNDMKTECRWAGGGNSTHRSCPCCTPPPHTPINKQTNKQKNQSPAQPSTRKKLKTIKPLPGGFVSGMGKGSWEGNIVLPSSTHHRPLGVPRLKAWRWVRRECFRRLTHHIQAPSRHPSWAPDGRAGLHSWLVR